MTKDEALKLALEAMKSFQNETNGLYEGEFEEEIKACEEALAQPEYQSTADKTKLEKVPAKGTLLAQPEQEPCLFVVSTKEGTHHCALSQRKPLTLWTEAQHERAYRNSPELHKDVKSLAAFKRVAKEIAAMYGIKGDA